VARSHATIKCSIWRDEDHLALSPASKLVYRFVLEQGRLTLVGSLDLVPGRWGGLLGMSRDRVEAAVAELHDAGFLVVDWDTDEVLVRTFTHHDLDPNRLNQNLARGLWGHWANVQSRALRSVAVHEMPEAVWARLEPHAPDDATQMRWSDRLEPEPRFPVGTGEPVSVGNLASEPTTTSHLPTATSHRAPPEPVVHSDSLSSFLRPVDEVVDRSEPDWDAGRRALRAIREGRDGGGAPDRAGASSGGAA
jgi:hypothetical protein